MAKGVSQTDFLELLDNFVLLYITITCYCMYNRLFSVSRHTKLSAPVKRWMAEGVADWTNRSVESCHSLRRIFRHVSTSIIVLLANYSLLFAQFRQYFVPYTMRYVPLGLKSSYNISFTNSLVLNKDKITISIKDSWTILTCIVWQFANRKKDTKKCPWIFFLHVLL